MIVLFTDFGLTGPYTGQMKAVLHRDAPGIPVIDLFADAPATDPQKSAYLLAAYAPAMPAGSILLCVVDPGVGSARPPLIARAGGRLFVGPGNGLFELCLRRHGDAACWRIDWRPGDLSASFHGRDLFAPVAAALARGAAPDAFGPAVDTDADAGRRPDWPDDLPAILYLDIYGNAMTGLRAAALPPAAALLVGGALRVRRARTFSDLPEGTAFWYENANGLAEIAVNRGRAAALPGIVPGAAIEVLA
ncbi:MAG: SAM-dependent chlorinase/fluorinase [Sneathiellaceae bacterium]